MKISDLAASIVIGEVAALLMVAISRNVTLPQGITPYIAWLPVAFPILTLIAMVVGSLLGRWVAVLYQLTKFTLVGGSNFLIDLGTLNVLIAFSGVATGFYANVFKALSFLVAVIWSFFWNKFWTFSARSVEHAGRQFTEFFAVTVVSFLINLGVFALLNDFVGARGGINPPTWASLSAAGAAVIGLIWNFIGYKFVVFRKEQG